MEGKITLGVIKADVGGFVGHSSMHEELIEEAKDRLEAAQTQDLIVDFHVAACGDDLELIMTHGTEPACPEQPVLREAVGKPQGSGGRCRLWRCCPCLLWPRPALVLGRTRQRTSLTCGVEA